MNIIIRKLNKNDIKPCVDLFYNTVHIVNANDYTPAEIEAWAPSNINPNGNRLLSLLTNISFVAEIESRLVGFIDMTQAGYLDHLYIHHDYQSKGIASALLDRITQEAKKLGLIEITTESSITAKPFFEAKGFKLIELLRKMRNEIELISYRMKKNICTSKY